MEVPRQSPSVSSSFEDSLMSKRTTPSAPASELRNLNISSSSSGSGKRSMPVTTRAMYRNYAAPRDTPSRTTAGPSRPSQRSGQAGSGGAARRAPPRRAAAAAAAAELSGDSAAEESDDDDDESDEEEEDRRASRSPPGDTLIRLGVFETFALSDPNYLTGVELARADEGSPETSQRHRRLALTVANQAIASPAFNASLQAVVSVPSRLYSELMFDRMSLRLAHIWSQLTLNIRNAAQGADVITTAAALRDFTLAVTGVTKPRHWIVASRETRRGYCSLLLTLLVNVVQQDRNIYDREPHTARPVYAGQRAEHSNLYLCLIGNPPHGEDPVFVVGLIRSLDPDGEYLAGSAQRIDGISQLVLDRHSVTSADGLRTSRGHPQPSDGFWTALRAIRDAVMRV
ncbi:hypothetical protein B0A48_02554 [Cryoendolithus antarcticus]|uniref:Uncharacterized protein n=1 Tax=Cryoendolithus antarcticus TaxID=1507870 RepID=A0A1V8TNZ7_9PEZI|nr:hypothetical protein B0A48_02554 [Cryoendolithus antarcticus]